MVGIAIEPSLGRLLTRSQFPLRLSTAGIVKNYLWTTILYYTQPAAETIQNGILSKYFNNY